MRICPSRNSAAVERFLRQRVAISGRPASQHVADVDVFALPVAGRDDFVEQLPGGADKRFALSILVGTRRFPDKHDRGVRITDPKDRLPPGFGQRHASLAPRHHLRQLLQRGCLLCWRFQRRLQNGAGFRQRFWFCEGRRGFTRVSRCHRPVGGRCGRRVQAPIVNGRSSQRDDLMSRRTDPAWHPTDEPVFVGPVWWVPAARPTAGGSRRPTSATAGTGERGDCPAFRKSFQVGRGQLQMGAQNQV